MISLNIQNLRSFADEVNIKIRPITLFVGSNNSGKSTITRLIPLIQQTFEARSSAPLLWYGKSVDFGSYSDCVNKDNRGAGIWFGFNIPREVIDKERWLFNEYGYAPVRLPVSSEGLDYRVKLVERNQRTVVSEMTLKCNTDSIVLRLGDHGLIERITVNDSDFTASYLNEQMAVQYDTMFPKIYSRKVTERHLTVNFPTDLKREKRQIIEPIFHGRTLEARRHQVEGRIQYEESNHFPREFRNCFKFSDYSHIKAAEFIKSYPRSFERLRRIIFLQRLPYYIESIEKAVRLIFGQSAYTGPSRAAGERYYRWQELAIDRIDPKGENFSMYLMSLTASELEAFNVLSAQGLGYQVQTDRSTGNASIVVREDGTQQWFNIADVGFGFSQVLPIFGQIHALKQPRRKTIIGQRQVKKIQSKIRIFAVEQPELHLHPAYQARLADLFVSCAIDEDKDGNKIPSGLCIVAETHSETLINRLSELVNDGKIQKEHVAIYIFDKQPGSSSSKIRIAEFTDRGLIQNWPFGFFSY